MIGSISLIGGTGRSGPGLALRFAARGVRVHIGSRDRGRGEEAAASVRERLAALPATGDGGGFAEVSGHDNLEAARLGEVAMLTVPYTGMAALLVELADALGGTTVISTVVPMEWRRELGPIGIEVADGSAAAEAARLLPGSRVVGGFHSLSSAILIDPERAVESDVIVCGDDADAKRSAIELAQLLPGVRGVDGGPLRYSRQSEQLTVLLVSINRANRCHAGVIVTDLPGR